MALLLVSSVNATDRSILLAHRTIADAPRLAQVSLAHTTPFVAGMFVAQFRTNINTRIEQRVQQVLGYKVADYVPHNALLVHLASSEQRAQLVHALEGLLYRLEPMHAPDRQESEIGLRAQSIVKERMAAAATTSPLADSARETAMKSQQPLESEVRESANVHKLHVYRNGTIGRSHTLHSANPSPSEPVVTLRARRIGRWTGSNESDALAAAIVAARCRTQVDIVYGSAHFALNNVHCDDAERTADTVVRALGDVAWISVEPAHTLLNRWAVPTVHRAADGERQARPLAVQDSTGKWKALLGLRGQGQIVSISDTGVALETCHFSAEQGDIPFSSGSAVPPDLGHSRIRAYTTGVGGDRADSNGHGTHVAGTVLGSGAQGSQASEFNGVAPDARLSFYDILPRCTSCGLAVPLDIGTDILQWSADTGARVHSASWGASNGGVYNGDAQSVDEYLWHNREFVAVFAAGNAGPSFGSIASPAVAKNSLAVGATFNGVEATNLVSGGDNGGLSDSAFSSEWVADFSARGSPSMSIAKPDVLAPGASFVWSASLDAPKNGACSPLGDTVLGIEGTSMATPAVAGAAALVYEALQRDSAGALGHSSDEQHRAAFAEHAGGSSTLERDGGGGLPVTGSLVVAMLTASARPTLGRFPQRAYASHDERRASEGAGRIALDRILGAAVDTHVLSNERVEHALTHDGDSVRACVAIGNLPIDAQVDDAELVIQLVYIDRPSTPGTRVGIINDLDLLVRDMDGGQALSVNGAAPGVTEQRSTRERVIVRPARSVDIQVRAAALRFTDAQTFSLVVTLRYTDVAFAALASSPPGILSVSPLSAASDNDACVMCDASLFVPKTQCATCGDGRRDANEQCEPSLDGDECCDETTCEWRLNGSLCSMQVTECRVRGRCQLRSVDGGAPRSECVPDVDVMYRVLASGDDGTCQPIPTPPTDDSGNSLPPQAGDDPEKCATSAGAWRMALIADPQLDMGRALCCTRYSAIAAVAIAVDPLWHRLALEFITVRLNGISHGALIDAELLLAVRESELLLEKTCVSTALLSHDDRDRGQHLLARLHDTQLGTICVDDEKLDDSCNNCVMPDGGASVSSARAALFCSGAPNRYVEHEHRCACSALHQAGEPDCINLACSGHGVSIRSGVHSDTNTAQCSCFPGWAGDDCSRCETATGLTTRFVCVGLPTSLVSPGSPTHVHRSVLSSSVAARLDGSFYAARGSPAKVRDALPGDGPFDCACSAINQFSAYTEPQSTPTHRASVEAWLDAQVAQMDTWAHAEALLFPLETLSDESDSNPKVNQPVRASSSSSDSVVSLCSRTITFAGLSIVWTLV